jgi:hypothetical protein
MKQLIENQGQNIFERVFEAGGCFMLRCVESKTPFFVRVLASRILNAEELAGLDLEGLVQLLIRNEDHVPRALGVLDVTTLSNEPKFDLITVFDAIHDQKSPDLFLRGINRALAAGGTFLMRIQVQQ